ncbi:unnamed protein product [Caenorhabditis sp. 36 PRJEB53466]|nr:unnamed protein product [Caenorhabditis sp. 36 PRJEB53466]
MEELREKVMAVRTCKLVDHNVLTNILLYIFQLAYAFPISILYLLVIFTILNKHRTERSFSDVYFRIYVLDGFVSLIVVILDFGLTRPLIYVNPICDTFLSAFPEPTYWLTPYLFFFNFFQFAKIFSISLMSANRYTCLAHPVFHKLFWRKHTRHAITVTLIAPIFCTWQLAISPTRLDVYNGEALLGYEKVVPFVRTTAFKLVVSLVAFVFLLFTNMKTYRVIRGKSSLKKLEDPLTLSTIVMSAVFVVYIIIQAILLIFSTTFLVENMVFGSFLKKFEFVCNDFYLMSSPIVLLIINKRLRTSIFRVSPAVPRNSSNTHISSTKAFQTVRPITKSPSAKTLDSNVARF